MDRKFLEGLGLDKDAIDKVLDANSAEIGTHKKQAEAYKTQLDDLGGKLKAFDGVDVNALRGEIDTLKADFSKKEADFATQIADRDFQAVLGAEISSARGKNPRALAALLDIAALKESKNQKEDIASAIKALQESDAYLFEETKPGVQISTGGTHSQSKAAEVDPFDAACAMYKKKE